ncbi:M23 family metallopeptidase [Pyxidicoccus fallax]|uniref:M23 family metallopeptidase n=1 Tax=Pyxidicoccus fallax TaxID=394095 RepID=A0A848LXH4_9BACT|nr:M23 family metallopeptidase [Pyxidicoccus fallax]NMO21954.1 M23 family metallopeptidase [Pyxidicoccus fallax]NPC86738.1 M23 family metallopeptidase [Pyxidicoccus fallax]
MFPSRAKGLLDFCMAALCLWAAYHHTPAGALVRGAVAWATGTRSTARPLLAYYDGVSGTSVSEPLLAPAVPLARPLTDAEALAWGTHLALKGLEPRARQPALTLATELGVSSTALLDAGEGPAAARKLHEALAADFPGEEARLAALFAGRVPARYALERVRAQGDAPTLEQLAQQLPPGFEGASVGAAQAQALATAFGLAWPVHEGARVTSPFGERIHPVLGTKKLHTGVDLGVPIGTEVVAVAEGVVRRASEDAVNGRVLVLDHGRGVTTAYCHNSELVVAVGQRVTRGQLVARSGNTGRSTGPHLHYQLELAARPMDPLKFRSSVRTVARDAP